MNVKVEPGTLLIVDDIPTNLKVLFDYLKSLGFKVRVAKNGEHALTQIVHTAPDLILLDIMMPGMDGFEVCRRLKADDKTRDIPVIFMTALIETVDKVKGFKLGAVDYITKPFQHEEVLVRINAHLTIRNLQKKLENKNLELQQHNAELDAFSHTVAHDVKSPSNAIIGLTDYLIEELSSSIDAKSLRMLRRIGQAGWDMIKITNSLMLLASVRHNQKVDMADINMDKVVTQAQQRLVQMIESYQVNITIPTKWPIARGYAPWIEEVWANYLSNGLKYGGHPPHLELGATPEENGYIRFWVRDNGQGLTSEEQSKLFVPFTRINQARVEGHGLGLSIVQRIIEKCGGQVGVESQVGQGSTFYFTLPAVE
ncbi:hybrid sensor histidine kinase/response regulator [Candidatus Parabeggiatoa sp. HSG14]|uniref:hybrid sensor histidine kinase/response regulator n=1 Tax=Candidatus Parabeggiatoa sp. HSG14 TaxID=3055593 RepID=UPI0025A6FADC|nr:hybrid sensor histidine kinase/response regulator [Thiotrichales bacterium HSG14]